jgi:hypothetical protein
MRHRKDTVLPIKEKLVYDVACRELMVVYCENRMKCVNNFCDQLKGLQCLPGGTYNNHLLSRVNACPNGKYSTEIILQTHPY